MRYAQLVMGPAGSGKSKYCSTIAEHGAVALKRRIDVVNLDPAAEHFDYQPLVDVRDLIHVEDVMEDKDMKFGPNGALVFCMEFLLENLQWLSNAIDPELDDDYILFDCPGQIELYTHLDVMKRLVDLLKSWNFRVVAVFILDSQFMIDGAKFISGSLVALSAMINLETPHVSILSKMDLLSPSAKRHLDSYLIPDTRRLCSTVKDEISRKNKSRRKHTSLNKEQLKKHVRLESKFSNLTDAFASVLDDYSLVSFLPLDINDEDNITDVLVAIDNTIQYGEDAEVDTRDKAFEEVDNDDT